MMHLMRYRLQILLSVWAVIFLAVTPAVHAEKTGELQVTIDHQVVYCEARLNQKDDAFSHFLKDGISIATIWKVQVSKARKYWLNKTIAEIVVVRRAVPDLLSRSWLLVDEASGISRRVYSMAEVDQFLSGLESFPVLDRSILLDNTPYQMSVSVVIEHGEMNEAWWGALWETSDVALKKEFTLP